MVDLEVLRSLVAEIPASAYAKYPRLTASGVARAVDQFIAASR
jgi:hypothetical protein